MNRRIIFSVCLTAGVLAGVALLSAQENTAASATSTRPDVAGSRRDLWSSHVRSPVGDGNAAELAEAIRRLESVRVRKKSDLFAEAKGPEATSQPVAPVVQSGRIDPETLAKLKQLPPGSIADPAALAETLFLSGHLEAAAPFYEMALENATDTDEKAWLLFQVANCYRKASPATAVKAYGKLLAEHPDSIWCPAAHIPKRIIEWRNANNLDGLLGELHKRTSQETPDVSGSNE